MNKTVTDCEKFSDGNEYTGWCNWVNREGVALDKVVMKDVTLSEVLCRISEGWEGAKLVKNYKYDKDRGDKGGRTSEKEKRSAWFGNRDGDQCAWTTMNNLESDLRWYWRNSQNYNHARISDHYMEIILNSQKRIIHQES